MALNTDFSGRFLPVKETVWEDDLADTCRQKINITIVVILMILSI
jgi:hypothetical protein